MTVPPDTPSDASQPRPVDGADQTVDDDAIRDPDLGDEPEQLRFDRRAPWKYLLPLLFVAVTWLVIGLVCSPVDFRF